uniref:Uncharacterized protein n=1 Tax=Panagrolaimus davidi TaxID=227884 RepID=A0A914QWP2_9BILA
MDLDIVTWCVANGVIWYPNINWETIKPQWIVEAINEWAIYVFGVNDEAHVQSIGEYNLIPTKNYSVGYMTATRFLVWLENHYPFIVKKLFQGSAIKRDYTDEFWIIETNKTVDELWIDYTKNAKTFRPKRDTPILFDTNSFENTTIKAKSSSPKIFQTFIYSIFVFESFVLILMFS